MSNWERVEISWYQHTTGAVVQRWGNGEWYAWRKQDPEHAYRTFRTKREAEAWALEEDRNAPDAISPLR